ncbi:serine/threonine-protein kinase [Sorangium sp. So ce887]|uniref:serine/threonine-protein kinase n=1 Tax=Sorangium sp. So ce887 TaxID=3133324 RepID=UPI003F5F5BA1
MGRVEGATAPSNQRVREWRAGISVRRTCLCDDTRCRGAVAWRSVATLESGDAPVPTAIGPYRIRGILGRGGMGVVYHGEHEQTRATAAVKTVFVLAETSLGGIRREIHALTRVRHPGIVRILGQGVAGGLPWYAMELLQGRTLQDHIVELWEGVEGPRAAAVDTDRTLPRGARPRSDEGTATWARRRAPPLLPTLSLLRKLCRPLSFLHGSGLVHRDLKPANVFVRADGTPVLVDFGISTHFGGARGRETLEQVDAAGTPRYMAPEQILGEPVDARADLYALGCILYECITGGPPFQAAQPFLVFQHHLYQPPRPPSLVVDGIPAQLEEVLMRLLEKRPQDRLGHADDLAAMLGELGAEDWIAPDMPKAELYIYRPTFSGRNEALRRIEGALASASKGDGSCVFLGGESGIGKTRLAMEAAALARRRGFLVITSECVAEAGGDGALGGAPLHPFRPSMVAIADRCREQGDMECASLLGDGAKVLALYDPSILDIPWVAELPEPPPLPPEQARQRVLDMLARAIFALSERRSLLLVVDDLQWADELSLAFLEHLASKGLAERELLILGTYRMEEVSAELAPIVRAHWVQHLALGRLSDASVGEMISGMLALAAPRRDLVELVAGSAEGNPFFVAEYLRAAIGERLVTRDRTGRWRVHERAEGVQGPRASLPLPTVLADLIDRRLSALGGPARRLTEWASVLGREFDGELLAAASGLEDTALLEALETLRVRQVIEESSPGRLRFAHDKIREIGYERIPEEQRRVLHGGAAAAIEARWPGAPELHAQLAHHFARAEVHDRASVHFAHAGDRARAAHANGEAIAFYRSALAEAQAARAPGAAGAGVPLEPEERVNEGLGDVLAITGRQDEARAGYTQALAGMPEGDGLARARLHRKIGKTWETHHRHEEALRCYALAEEALGAAPPESGSEATDTWWHAWVHVQMDRTWVHYWLAQVDELAALVEKVRPHVERRGTPRQRMQFFQAVMHMDLRRDRYVASDETARYARASMAASEEAGDPNEIAGARFALGFTLLSHGDLSEAEAELGAALRDAERMGDVTLQSRCLAYLMMTHRRRRAIARTRALAEQTLTVATDGKMMDYVGAARANLGWVALCESDRMGAASRLQTALETWRLLALAYPFQWMALLPLMAIELDAGRIDEAVEHARALIEPKQQRLPDSLAVPLGEATLAARDARAADARAHLDRAIEAAKRLVYL